MPTHVALVRRARWSSDEFGDLSVELDTRIKSSVASFCGKESYEFGDLSKEIGARVSTRGPRGRESGDTGQSGGGSPRTPLTARAAADDIVPSSITISSYVTMRNVNLT